MALVKSQIKKRQMKIAPSGVKEASEY